MCARAFTITPLYLHMLLASPSPHMLMLRLGLVQLRLGLVQLRLRLVQLRLGLVQLRLSLML